MDKKLFLGLMCLTPAVASDYCGYEEDFCMEVQTRDIRLDSREIVFGEQFVKWIESIESFENCKQKINRFEFIEIDNNIGKCMPVKQEVNEQYVAWSNIVQQANSYNMDSAVFSVINMCVLHDKYAEHIVKIGFIYFWMHIQKIDKKIVDYFYPLNLTYSYGKTSFLHTLLKQVF